MESVSWVQYQQTMVGKMKTVGGFDPKQKSESVTHDVSGNDAARICELQQY